MNSLRARSASLLALAALAFAPKAASAGGECCAEWYLFVCIANKSAGTLCRSSTGPCDPAEYCTGSSMDCPTNKLYPAGTLCRSSAGSCDQAEYCDGTSNYCPSDAKKPAGTLCRSSAGTCDKAEYCDGTSNYCPSDTFLSSSNVCRSSAGVCDKAEYCTGSSATCPSDAFQPSTTVCRASAGTCDKPEYCTGSSATCPSDAFQPSTTVCRAAGGQCDSAEYCSGTSAQCPADVKAADGTSCENASVCISGGTCTSGVCLGGTEEITFDPAQTTVTAGSDATITIKHSGSGAAIQLTGVDVDPATSFRIASQPTWPVTLASGQSTTVSVAMNTATPGQYDGALVVHATGCADLSAALVGNVSDAPGSSSSGGGCGYGSGAAAFVLLAPLLALLLRVRRQETK